MAREAGKARLVSRLHACLPGIALAAAIGIGCVLVATVKPADPLAFEAVLVVPDGGHAQLYYDSAGRGFTEAASIRVPLVPTTRPQVCRFPLRFGPWHALRLDPADHAGVVTILDARVVTASGREVIRFSPRDFIPEHEIARTTENANALVIEPVPGATDPWLRVRLEDEPLYGESGSPGRWALRLGWPLLLGIAALLAGRSLYLCLNYESSTHHRQPERAFGAVALAATLTLAGSVAAASFVYLANQRFPTAYLEFLVKAAEPVTLQVFFDDDGGGFEPTRFTDIELEGSAEPQRCRLQLPGGMIRRLRLDPAFSDTVVTVSPMRIVDAAGWQLHAFATGDLVPLHEIARLEPAGEWIRIVPETGSIDPYLELRLAAPLQTAYTGRHLGWAMFRPAALVLLVGICITGALSLGLIRRTSSRLVALGSAAIQGRPLGLVWLGCVAVLFARRPDAFFLPQFWAEDGMFFQSDYIWGFHALFQPYNGYHHLVPRLIAAFAGRLDFAFIPAAYFATSVVLTLYVASLTLSPRFPFRRHVGYPLAVVLVPDAFEVLLNVANVQWILAAGLIVLLLLGDPTSPAQKGHDVVAAALLGLTGPFSVVLAPFFIVRAWQRRTRWSLVLAGVIGAAALIQGYNILRGSTPFPVNEAIHYEHGFAALGLRTGGSLLLGAWLPAPRPIWLGIVLAVLTVAAWAFLTFRPGSDRPARIMLGLAAACILAGGLYRYRAEFSSLLGTLIGARYFYGAQLALLWLTMTLLTSGSRRLVTTGAAVLLLFFAANVTRLREPAFRDFRWRDYVDDLRQGKALVIPTNPPGATFTVPARQDLPAR